VADNKRLKRKYLIDINKTIPKQSKRSWFKNEVLPFTADASEESSVDSVTASPYESVDDDTPGSSGPRCSIGSSTSDTVSDIEFHEDDVEPVSSDIENTYDVSEPEYASDNADYCVVEVLTIYLRYCLHVGLISSWMHANLLTLDSSKTEFLLIGLSKQLSKIHTSVLDTSHSARNLGFIFDNHLTLTDQIDSLSKSCYSAICQLCCICPYLDYKAASTIATPIVHSRLDYCNCIMDFQTANLNVFNRSRTLLLVPWSKPPNFVTFLLFSNPSTSSR